MNAEPAPVRVELQLATELPDLPAASDFTRWANRAFARADMALKPGSCVTIRLVDEAESQTLNGTFRHVHKPTNVLAFPVGPMNAAVAGDEAELGDLAICAAVVMREAREQSKTVTAHFAHMTIHGCLHLAGFDHMDDIQAAEMESLEEQAMADLGFPAPYGHDEDDSSNA